MFPISVSKRLTQHHQSYNENITPIESYPESLIIGKKKKKKKKTSFKFSDIQSRGEVYSWYKRGFATSSQQKDLYA